MRADLPDLLPLICIACARTGDGRSEVSTVALERAVREGGGEVLEGILRCKSCGRAYPIVDGVPILVDDLGSFLARELPGLIDPALDPAVAALLVAPGPDDTPLARALEVLSIYLDAHWGDRATPPPDGPLPHAAPLLDKLSGHPRVERALELGCSVGRGLFELVAGADLVVGVDHGFGALRRARHILSGGELRYARRVAGRHYREATITAPPAASPAAQLLCADTLSPPLLPGGFARVAAFNLIDAVHDPGAQLAIARALVAAGGELHLASPYAWQSNVVGEQHRIGGADPAADVRRLLEDGGFAVELEEDVDWWLRRDARAAVAYRVHYVRARRLGLA